MASFWSEVILKSSYEENEKKTNSVTQKSSAPDLDDPEQLPDVPYDVPLDPSTGAWFRHSRAKNLLFFKLIEKVFASRITGTCSN